jgi:FtsP/CotA-like multicopper oxidase with cupredoxin domain
VNSSFPRIGLAVCASLAVVAAGGLAAGVRPPLAHHVAAAATPPATPPCIPNAPTPVPNVTPARIPLPQPPVQDTTKPGQSSFTLYVKMNADGTHFCYTTTPEGDRSYVEAPTIIAARGGTFTMTFVNNIPSPASPSPVPTPPRRTGNVDGCAWLPYEGDALPQPTPPTPAPGYFNHPRAEHPGMPPWMLANDTNFHTHGWHVSPYVDNVFKSLVYAPRPNVCVFKFQVRASQPPGTYWYHSHMHGISSVQVGGGLAGALIVVPDAPAIRNDVLLIVKNAPRSQTATLRATAPANAMAPTGAMGDMGQERLVQHYARVFSVPQTLPSPAASSSPVPFDPFNPPPWYAPAPITGPYCPPLPTVPSQVAALAVNGAVMPVVINGTKTPATGPSVSQIAGQAVRYRVLNAAANAYLNLAVTSGGARVPLDVIGRDGVPVNWDPATSSIDPTKPAVIQEPNVFIAPSGRVDIVVTMRTSDVRLVSLAGTPSNTGAPPTKTPFCMGYAGFAIPDLEVLTIHPAFVTANGRLGGTPANAAPKPVHALTIAGAFARRQAGIPRRAITFTQYPDPPGPPEWYTTPTAPLTPRGASPRPAAFTERPFFLAPSTPVRGANPYVPQIQVRQNSIEEWDIFNASPEIHAFHIHQLTFVAIESPFEATDPYRQVFLDSIPLPAAKLAPPDPSGRQKLVPSVTRIVIDFHRVDTGPFVFHCHMLFHEDHGMMGIVEVLPPLAKPKS